MDSASQQALTCPACNSHYDGAVVFCPKDGTRLVAAGAPAPSLVGSVLAERYRVTRKIGEGGMGEVYEAGHVFIDKKFAIKLLRPEITSNPEAVARFHQEARSASSIGHENIVGIDDFGRLPDGSVYLAMELLSGQSLADRLRKQPTLGLDETLAVAIQSCCGLAAAHSKGIVHRDMKPENLFLTERHGQLIVKVLDFGIAKVAGEGSQQNLTRTGQVFGTPHYMSPEQALGKSLDHRTDIYSLGVILYEMATGRVPYQAESFMGILTQHITATPVPPRTLAPEREIPPPFEALILRAMAKEPAQRFASMDEMAQALVALAQELAPALGGASKAYQAISFEARLGSGAMQPARLPSGGFIPLGSGTDVVAPLSPSGVVPAAAPAPARSSGMWWLLILGILAATAGVVVVAVVMLKPKPQPPPEPLIIKEVVKVTEPAEPLPGATEIEVLVDTEPGRAGIFSGGKRIAESPEVVKVQRGGTLEVTLRKDGYLDKTVTLDPARSRKVIYRLERKASPRSDKKPVDKTPEVTPVVVTPVKPPKHDPKHDPKHGPATPPKPGDVLDPYQ